MPKLTDALTPQLQAQILAAIRQGAYPPIAAEACGIPAATFTRWIEKGLQKKAPKTYRAFAREIAAAAAQARMMAEVKCYRDKPYQWLRHHPGMGPLDYPDWTNYARLILEEKKPQLPQEAWQALSALAEAAESIPGGRQAALDAYRRHTLTLPTTNPRHSAAQPEPTRADPPTPHDANP